MSNAEREIVNYEALSFLFLAITLPFK